MPCQAGWRDVSPLFMLCKRIYFYLYCVNGCNQGICPKITVSSPHELRSLKVGNCIIKKEPRNGEEIREWLSKLLRHRSMKRSSLSTGMTVANTGIWPPPMGSAEPRRFSPLRQTRVHAACSLRSNPSPKHGRLSSPTYGHG